MNQPIQLLGNVIDRGMTKFSVKGTNSYSIVHISFYLGKYMSTCLDRVCASLFKRHKKIPKRISISKRSKCCSHLNMLCDNIEYVKAFFPHYFDKGNIREFEYVTHVQQEEVSSEDADINVQDSGNFNWETGLWNFKSLSTHKPFENSMDPGLIFGTQERNDLVNSSNIDIDSGVYKELHLKPCVNGKICQHGECYVEEMCVGVYTVYCILYTAKWDPSNANAIVINTPLKHALCLMKKLQGKKEFSSTQVKLQLVMK